jgi:uncharacterized protein (DUF2235 family)
MFKSICGFCGGNQNKLWFQTDKSETKSEIKLNKNIWLKQESKVYSFDINSPKAGIDSFNSVSDQTTIGL